MDLIKIYLSGPITGHKDWKKEFKEAEAIVRKIFSKEYKTVLIINPADKPWNVDDGFAYEDCLHIDYACIDISDIIMLLPGWQDSPGAKRELAKAESVNVKAHDLEAMIKGIEKTERDKIVIRDNDAKSEYARDLVEDKDVD